MEQGTLEKKIAKLPDSSKLKLEGYVDALLDEVKQRAAGQTEIQKRFGGLKGFVTYIADDFDDPLEEFKDYM